MKLREAILWTVAVTLAVGWPWSARKANEANAEVSECANHLLWCAESLEAREKLCSETSAKAMERAVQLFQCQADVCEANGWQPPVDWDEARRMIQDEGSR